MGGAPGLLIFALPGPEALPPPPPWAVLETTHPSPMKSPSKCCLPLNDGGESPGPCLVSVQGDKAPTLLTPPSMVLVPSPKHA